MPRKTPFDRSLRILSLLVTTFFCLAPAAAVAGNFFWDEFAERHLVVRGFGIWGQPIGDLSGEGSFAGSAGFDFPSLLGSITVEGDFTAEGAAEAKGAPGIAGSVEWLLGGGWIGVEVGRLAIDKMVDYDVSLQWTNTTPEVVIPPLVESGSIDGTMVAVAFNFHWRVAEGLDLYAGPAFGPAIDITEIDAVRVADGLAYGATVGADFLRGEHFLFSIRACAMDFGRIELDEHGVLNESIRFGGLIDAESEFTSTLDVEKRLRFAALMAGAGFSF